MDVIDSVHDYVELMEEIFDFSKVSFFFSVAVRTKILITSNLTKFLLIQDTKAHIRRIVGKAFPHSN